MDRSCSKKTVPELHPIMHVYDSASAAEYLANGLGGSQEDWLKFLEADRDPAIDDNDREFLFNMDGDEYIYDECDLFLFVRARTSAPAPITSVADVSDFKINFYCDATGDIDFSSDFRLMVYLVLPEKFDGRPWLTPDDAREFANSLLFVADWCDTHQFDPESRRVVVKPDIAALCECVEGGK